MSNPFSTKFWSAGVIPFQFSEQEKKLEALLEIAQQHPICQIVGPHGSGKSTLLQSLIKQYEKNGENVRYLLFNEEQRHLPDDLTFPENQLLIVDGFEQLSFRERLKLLLRSKRLILTVHHPVWFVPILYRTQPEFSIFVQLVRQLAPDPPEESTLRAMYDRSGGNFRTAFFELYDDREEYYREEHKGEEYRKEGQREERQPNGIGGKIIRLTPAGRGAVASFLLCGEKAVDTFLLHWQGKVPGEHPVWGRLPLTDTGDGEEAVVYRTDEGIEIHTHGGEQVASAIKALFEKQQGQRQGAVCETWQEHFAAGTSQQNLALRLLPFAPTERTVQILLDQYNGAFDWEMSAIERLPDGDERRRRQTRLQELAPLGKHLVEPFRVVLAGASNAGKSSLLNAILGFQRSLVHSLPGTTRDVVSGQTALDGFPVTFFDTAGFRETGDDLEQQGIDRSQRSLADTDLIVWVVDETVEEPQRPPCPAGANVLVCSNKIDLFPTKAQRHKGLNTIGVSALTGEGIESLLDKVIRRLVPHPPQPGEAVPLL